MPEPVIVSEGTVGWTTISPHLLSLLFLMAACVCSFFSDMNTVSALPCIGFPLFWLASVLMLGFDGNDNNDNNTANPENISNKKQRTNRLLFHVVYFLLPCLCRTWGTVDYFHLGDISKRKAYGISFLILIPILGTIYGAFWIQHQILWILPRHPGQESSSSSLSSSGFVTVWKTMGPLTFPILLTAFYQLLFRFSPIGATGNPAMGFPGVISLPLQQGIVSVVGEIGLIFAIGLVSSVGAASLVVTYGKQQQQQRHSAELSSQQSCYNYWILFLVIMYSVVEISGGCRLAQGLWENPIADWPLAQALSLQVSCICQGGARENMLNKVQTRLDAGDDLIVLSEGAIFGRVAPQFFSWPEENSGAVIAIAFIERVANTNSTPTTGRKFYNSVEFLQGGTSLFRYDKNRPVPLVETGVLPGATPPTSTEIVFTPKNKITQKRSNNVTLQVAAAICFDFEFPHLFRQQQQHAADLVVGPSNYWGSIGKNLWSNNRHRAIENGFTLFKCSRNGISGAVDPLGQPLWQQPTLEGEQVTTLLPVRSRVSTVYANYLGYWFGWVCVGVAPLWFIWALYLTRRNMFTTTRTNNTNTIEHDDVALLENENNVVRNALEEPLLSSNDKQDDVVLLENKINTARSALEETPLLSSNG